MTHRKFVLALLLSAFSACASGPMLDRVDPATKALPPTSLALTYHFKSGDQLVNEGECTITFRDYGRSQAFSTHFAPPSGTLLIAAPEGKTQITNVYCYRKANWIFEQDPEWAAPILAGKINFLGTLDFSEATDRELHLHWRQAHAEETRKLRNSLATNNQGNLVESYPPKLFK